MTLSTTHTDKKAIIVTDRKKELIDKAKREQNIKARYSKINKLSNTKEVHSQYLSAAQNKCIYYLTTGKQSLKIEIIEIKIQI